VRQHDYLYRFTTVLFYRSCHILLTFNMLDHHQKLGTSHGAVQVVRKRRLIPSLLYLVIISSLPGRIPGLHNLTSQLDCRHRLMYLIPWTTTTASTTPTTLPKRTVIHYILEASQPRNYTPHSSPTRKSCTSPVSYTPRLRLFQPAISNPFPPSQTPLPLQYPPAALQHPPSPRVRKNHTLVHGSLPSPYICPLNSSGGNSGQPSRMK
jgi:hypothetical protein